MIHKIPTDLPISLLINLIKSLISPITHLQYSFVQVRIYCYQTHCRHRGFALSSHQVIISWPLWHRYVKFNQSIQGSRGQELNEWCFPVPIKKWRWKIHLSTLRTLDLGLSTLDSRRGTLDSPNVHPAPTRPFCSDEICLIKFQVLNSKF